MVSAKSGLSALTNRTDETRGLNRIQPTRVRKSEGEDVLGDESQKILRRRSRERGREGEGEEMVSDVAFVKLGRGKERWDLQTLEFWNRESSPRSYWST